MKNRLLLVLAVVIAVTASAAAYYRVRGADDAPHFTTTTVTRGDLVESVAATGTLEAVTTVQVGTQVSGTIRSLSADFNTRVRKGQVVARLEPSLFQAQVDQAEANVVRMQADVERARVQVEDAQAKLRRAQDLSNQQLISRSELETAASTAKEAEAQLRSAEAQVVQGRASLNQNQVTLGHTVITAPIDGIVISRNVDVGQTVAASTSAPTLFVIAQDLTQMRVNASVDESDIGRILERQNVTFHVDAYPDDLFRGVVSQVRLQPVTDSNVVSYVTVIDVPNPELKLKPGMTANVTIEVARADAVLKVPASALRFRPTDEAFAALGQELPKAAPGATTGRDPASGTRPAGGGRVWVLADNRLTPVRVQSGISDGATIAVTGGDIKEGAEVVTAMTATTTTTSSTTSSPLIPQRPNRGGQGAQGTTGAGGQR